MTPDSEFFIYIMVPLDPSDNMTLDKIHIISAILLRYFYLFFFGAVIFFLLKFAMKIPYVTANFLLKNLKNLKM